jgi:hypothetical protein
MSNLEIDLPHLRVRFIPLDPPKPGWRQDAASGEEFYSHFWLALDEPAEPEATSPVTLLTDVSARPKPKAVPGPTPEQQEAWATEIVLDSLRAAERNLEKLSEISRRARESDDLIDAVGNVRAALTHVLRHRTDIG